MKQILDKVFLLVIIFGISQTSATSQTISFVRPNYEIKFSNNWAIDTSNARGTEFFICPESEMKKESKSQLISLIIQNLANQNIDIAKYKQITERQMANVISDGKIYESKIVQSPKGQYFKMVSSFTQNTRKLKSIQICFIKNEKAYLLTFTTDLNKFDLYKNAAERILNSFKLNI